MALSRRNILVALGAVVGGGGALVGTGAFTTVSAQRSVDVSTAGDASAFLQITADDEYVPANDGGPLTINLAGTSGGGFNKNAITTIDGIVTITNNAADESDALVGVSTTDPGNDPQANGQTSLQIQDSGGTTVAVVTFYVSPTEESSNNPSISSGSTQTIPSGNSAELDVEVDTTEETLTNTSAPTGGLTIVATEP